MKNGLVIILVTFMLANFSHAQRWKLKRVEAIAGVGVANVFGDIGGSSERETLLGIKDYKLKDTRPSIYLGARFRLSNEHSLKLNLINGFGAASDKGARNELNRDYSFSTYLFEPSLQYEYSFLSEDRNTKSSAMFSRKGMINTFSMLSIYGFAGFGGVLYIPKFEGTLLSTDTVSTKTGFSPVIPIGLGLKYVVNSEVSLNLEIGRRFTFTDYIDGLTTIFSNSNDIYYIGTISVIYKLTTTRSGIPIIFESGFKKRQSGVRSGKRRKPIGM